MFQYICFDTEIRLWWDEREDRKEGMRYKVIVDGCAYIITKNRYYDFSNLEADREYRFELQLIDKNRNVIGKTESIKLSTLKKREIIDLTNQPYSAKPDGKTNNTEAIQKALNDSVSNKSLRFPFGTFVCDKLEFSGDVELHFDVGAIVCNSYKEKEL